jgi:hypothetical protein
LVGALTPCLVGGLVLTSLILRGASSWTAVVFGFVPACLCLVIGALLLVQVVAHRRGAR